nr:hypothetical protein [Pseudomonadales bacterium]
MELLVLMSLPLAGALLLALLGERRYAAHLNVLISFGTFLAGCALTARVIRYGPQLVWNENFFVDSFNVFLTMLTAFVSLTTALFSRDYMRIEESRGKLNRARLRLYHSMYQ